MKKSISLTDFLSSKEKVAFYFDSKEMKIEMIKYLKELQSKQSLNLSIILYSSKNYQTTITNDFKIGTAQELEDNGYRVLEIDCMGFVAKEDKTLDLNLYYF